MSAHPLTVLVVDDEQLLREELRTIPWHELGAELAGEAENGEEALALCEAIEPDVVITDITMPVMDGIELSRRVRERYPFTQVVILTCHSEFDYAREAMKLGALEYLIKVSLDESELAAVLGRAREAIRREEAHRRSERERKRLELSKALSRLPKEEGAAEAALAQLRELVGQLPVGAARLHVACNAEDRFHARLALYQALEELGPTAGGRLDYTPLGETDAMLWLKPRAGERRGEARAAAKPEHERVLQRLREALEAQLPYLSGEVRLYTLIGPDIGQAAQLLAALKETEPAGALLFYERPQQAFFAGEWPGDRSLAEAPEREAMEREWLHAAEPRALADYLKRAWLPWAERCRVRPSELVRWALTLRAKSAEVYGWEPLAAEAARQLEVSPTFAQFAALLLRAAESDTTEQQKCRKEIREAKQIIADRLAEPITLTSVAEEVGLSSFYLSRLFREEVGESFNEYVTRLRIQEAIRLLQTTTLKVYEVAERVGIPSYRYFTVLFRGRTGVSPTDFKKG